MRDVYEDGHSPALGSMGREREWLPRGQKQVRGNFPGDNAYLMNPEQRQRRFRLSDGLCQTKEIGKQT